jgi:hypothetical protein
MQRCQLYLILDLIQGKRGAPPLGRQGVGTLTVKPNQSLINERGTKGRRLGKGDMSVPLKL